MTDRTTANPSGAFRRALQVCLRDGIGLSGAASVVYGVHLMHPPSAFLAAGGMMIAVAVASARKSG